MHFRFNYSKLTSSFIAWHKNKKDLARTRMYKEEKNWKGFGVS